MGCWGVEALGSYLSFNLLHVRYMLKGQIIGDLIAFSTYLAHFDFQEARNNRGEVNRSKEYEETRN